MHNYKIGDIIESNGIKYKIYPSDETIPIGDIEPNLCAGCECEHCSCEKIIHGCYLNGIGDVIYKKIK